VGLARLRFKNPRIVGFYVGDQSRESREELWKSLPPVYRQGAVCNTDFWQAYNGVFPEKPHKSAFKSSRQTREIERFNNKLRQGISRLVRKSLSLYKKLENPMGALWYFIHHYSGSQKSEVCPIPYALCPMPYALCP